MNATDLKFICAVDGGGTGCRVAIAGADGAVLASSNGGPANFATDAGEAVASVLDAVGSAAGQLSIDENSLPNIVAHIGLAGIMNEADAIALASQLPFDICSVSDDRETSLIGALGTKDGVVLAIGTGSFVALRRGETSRFFGGWGLDVGDQASGAWLGCALLESTLLAVDGIGDESELTRAILTQFEGSPASIVKFGAKAQPVDYAAYAPDIVDAAKAEDPVARALMMLGAKYLNAALRAADIGDDEVICLTGGVGPHYQAFLSAEYHDRIRPPKGSALDGALMLARKKLELETPT